MRMLAAMYRLCRRIQNEHVTVKDADGSRHVDMLAAMYRLCRWVTWWAYACCYVQVVDGSCDVHELADMYRLCRRIRSEQVPRALLISLLVCVWYAEGDELRKGAQTAMSSPVTGLLRV